MGGACTFTHWFMDGRAVEKSCIDYIVVHTIYYNRSRCPRSQYWMDHGVGSAYSAHNISILKLLLLLLNASRWFVLSARSLSHRDLHHYYFGTDGAPCECSVILCTSGIGALLLHFSIIVMVYTRLFMIYSRVLLCTRTGFVRFSSWSCGYSMSYHFAIRSAPEVDADDRAQWHFINTTV
jgi:hypothetical protein